ncbi:MAG TPA: 2-(1,2-epoxy-1,2-dihydrophenyl)acetyl-CoA isomerase PaaG [Gemmatimonadales bacterium]|jgi:2-(1,2-epoxy-1,2-dihydrophenyl)acetyl-CoA isomerase|nr:2-(1,2-epoxy-1,2-dihydrophenyl)acetyl-CoA isomerase PaaG [Gemmatimonadales bacterium]
MTYRFILFEIDQGVARITLNRPDVLNSIHTAMSGEIRDGLARAERERDIRAVLLTGNGRGFCAGQDLDEVRPGATVDDFAAHARKVYTPLVRGIRALEKPVVCAVNGVAAGAGANLALACDLVLAAEEASFVQAFAKIGLVPDTGGSFFLPRLVGLARATALTMLGEKVTARQAVEIGLIYRACPGPALHDEASKLALHLATQPTLGLGLTKRLLNASLANDLDAQLEIEAELQGVAGRSADYAEGVAAFLAKRKPLFTGQ